ncbi:hypothetical protein BC938DRAFT_481201 [Jimgerdemannia flammicorona]|uniref:Uncharacterized protein n=1 Tax=Jimgerdemannia flammicorona TaxID=994334 RepID=A0A433QGN4_9FUNG|nr:hypothetical protein BC938DRAFT_481201 [Jimgerdemannia flammicorona]
MLPNVHLRYDSNVESKFIYFLRWGLKIIMFLFALAFAIKYLHEIIVSDPGVEYGSLPLERAPIPDIVLCCERGKECNCTFTCGYGDPSESVLTPNKCHSVAIIEKHFLVGSSICYLIKGDNRTLRGFREKYYLWVNNSNPNPKQDVATLRAWFIDPGNNCKYFFTIYHSRTSNHRLSQLMFPHLIVTPLVSNPFAVLNDMVSSTSKEYSSEVHEFWFDHYVPSTRISPNISTQIFFENQLWHYYSQLGGIVSRMGIPSPTTLYYESMILDIKPWMGSPFTEPVNYTSEIQVMYSSNVVHINTQKRGFVHYYIPNDTYINEMYKEYVNSRPTLIDDEFSSEKLVLVHTELDPTTASQRVTFLEKLLRNHYLDTKYFLRP